MSIWGVQLDNANPAEFALPGAMLNLNHAILMSGENVFLKAKDPLGNEFVVARLANPHSVNVPLNLTIAEEMSLVVEGEGSVYVSGTVEETESSDEESGSCSGCSDPECETTNKDDNSCSGCSNCDEEETADKCCESGSCSDNSDSDEYVEITEEEAKKLMESGAIIEELESQSNSDSEGSDSESLNSADIIEDIESIDEEPVVEKKEKVEEPVVEKKEKVKKAEKPAAEEKKTLSDKEKKMAALREAREAKMQEAAALRKQAEEAKKVVEAKKAEVAKQEAELAAKKAKLAETVATKNKGKVVLKGGLTYEIISPGTGKEGVKNGQNITVKYKGTLATTGKEFDRGQFGFRVGTGNVVAGFDKGVVGMLMNETRRLLIPAKMGYGSQRVGGIPPNSDLVFEIKLTSIKK